MVVVIRVVSQKDEGLGHIARCLVLAKALEANDHCVHFVVDNFSKKLSSFLANRSVLSLDAELLVSEQQDAQSTLQLISDFALSPDWIIVDHYGLGKAWELQIQQAGFRVLAIDDLVRAHSANAVLDFKWRGNEAENIYRPMVSDDCQLLLGPQYLLIERPQTFEIANKSNPEFRLLFGLGGGGCAIFAKSLVTFVLEHFAQAERAIYLKVVIGPLMTNPEVLLDWQPELGLGSELEFVQGKTDLSFENQWCDFYLGAAGGTLYQLRALQKPSLLFSLAPNQENQQALLDEIGQYLYLENLQTEQFFELAQLLLQISQQPKRIQTLFQTAKVPIGWQGSQNVVNFLTAFEHSAPLTQMPANDVWQACANGYFIRPVEDSDINHYLASRNHPANRQNMLDTSEISKLSHYRWWLQTPRRSFLLAKENTPKLYLPKLYIWDQLKTFEGEEYLIGGWFVCDDSVSHTEAMVALDWQLTTCAKEYPHATWVAVISRQNRYVKLMNDYFGFKEIPEDSRYNRVVNKFFPSASKDEFFYVYK